ncbi:hypothetical protein [Reyranella soli]|uniref:Uncharacterized protein n=1 Tax=Reyranella soli TaxID=1230389 RepID=A0A512NQI9_9HYPH|nr:hypothetical protein [Reyranella soli]GEP61214.1 hypothetical protein RSO01_83800 [Reyranella soli]
MQDWGVCHIHVETKGAEMKKCIATLCLILFANAVSAQQAMSGDELKKYVSGKAVELSDGIATYKADGKYEYWARSSGQTSRGKWSAQGDRVCVDFDSGGNRCDQYLKDSAGKVSLKNSRGTTYPVVSVK